MHNIKIGIILRLLLTECNLDEISLSRKINIPKSTISRLLNHDVNPTIDTLYPISQFFNITISQLIGEEELPKDRLPGLHKLIPYTTTRIPILTFAQIEQYLSNEPTGDFVWISTEKQLVNKSFSLIIKTEEFNLFFNKNTLIIVNNITTPQYGDIILIKHNDIITLRQVIIDDNCIYLQKLHPKLNKLQLKSHTDIIFGVVVESRHEFVEDNFSTYRENYHTNHVVIPKLV